MPVRNLWSLQLGECITAEDPYGEEKLHSAVSVRIMIAELRFCRISPTQVTHEESLERSVNTFNNNLAFLKLYA